MPLHNKIEVTNDDTHPLHLAAPHPLSKLHLLVLNCFDLPSVELVVMDDQSIEGHAAAESPPYRSRTTKDDGVMLYVAIDGVGELFRDEDDSPTARAFHRPDAEDLVRGPPLPHPAQLVRLCEKGSIFHACQRSKIVGQHSELLGGG